MIVVRSLLARELRSSSPPRVHVRSAPFTRLERMLARVERGFDRGFSTYAGRGVSRMPLSAAGVSLASRNLRESRMGLWPVIGSLSWLGAIPASG